ncbi:MAG TPA: DNA polymerase Y family protein, partial [Caulobacteraceae bacterium]
MARILCVWSPNWAIANWKRRNPCASPGEAAGAHLSQREREGPAPLEAWEGEGLPGLHFNPSSSHRLQRRAPPSPSGRRVLSARGDDKPFALIATVGGVRRLSAVDGRAARLGLFVGQKATDAAALVPELIGADAEDEADATALTALGDWCVRFSPAVALDPPDGLYLDIGGAAHLWDGEAAMLADLLARLEKNHIPARAAVADTPGCAWALAHFAAANTIAPAGHTAAHLAPLPVRALRLAGPDADQIGRLGL